MLLLRWPAPQIPLRCFPAPSQMLPRCFKPGDLSHVISTKIS